MERSHRRCAAGKTAAAGRSYGVFCENFLEADRTGAKLLAMNRRDFLLRSGAAVSAGLLSRVPLLAQAPAAASTASAPPPVRPPAPVTEFKELRRGVGTFTGRGGTIGWLSNRDALVAVDTQFPETAAIFLAGLPGRDGRMLDAVIDTHHHGDHTGGNGTLRPAARRLVAQQNVPALQRAAAARSPQAGEPVLPDTLFADTWRLEAGDEVVTARYFGPAHTGGDIAVHFEKANVVHLGDLVFNRLYPVTDKPGGVQVRSWIGVLETILRSYPADALYVFGHGNPKFGITGGRAELARQRDFLTALVAHVEAERKAGKPKEEIVELANLPGWDDWHAAQNSRLPGNLGVVYDELAGA